MPKGSDNPFPSVLVVEGTTPSNPASGDQRLFIDSSDHILKYVDSTGAVTSTGGGSGIASGTSFPGSPTAGDLFERTDIESGLICVYDGTRWLSHEIFPIAFSLYSFTWPLTATTIADHRGVPPFGSDYDLYLMDWESWTTVLTTNSGSAYWTVTLYDGAGSLASFNTSADTHDVAYSKKVAINAVEACTGASAGNSFYTYPAKTSTPGNLRFIAGRVNCRIIVT
jgi:hypothetical protein